MKNSLVYLVTTAKLRVMTNSDGRRRRRVKEFLRLPKTDLDSYTDVAYSTYRHIARVHR